MNYKEALSYVHTVSSLGSIPGLDRIRELCERFGHPEQKLNIIHIAGTNGKGSVSAMLASIYQAMGLKVGLFTSPFIYNFNERFKINGCDISDEDFANLITRIAPVADSMDDHPSEFELDCITGFLWFCESNCDIVIMETGLGGRLDGTNVIEHPVATVITGISLDHTSILGNTTAEIAAEKAGIIKANSPVIIGKCDDDARKVIIHKANEMDSKVVEVDYSLISEQEYSLKGNSFKFGDCRKYEISLAGYYQPENAAIAITTANTLGIEDKYIREGLLQAKWPARFELLSENPIIIYDGGHNPEGVESTAESIRRLFDEKIVVLTGMLKDKDYRYMSEILSSIACETVCITPPISRALNANLLADVFQDFDIRSTSCSTIEQGVKMAVSRAIETERPLLIVGSLYMYHDVRDAVYNVIAK